MAKQQQTMVRIRMLTSAAGPRHNLRINHEYDWPEDEALRFVEAGIAELVEEPKTK